MSNKIGQFFKNFVAFLEYLNFIGFHLEMAAKNFSNTQSLKRSNFPFIDNLKKPASASKRDGLVLATLRIGRHHLLT